MDPVSELQAARIYVGTILSVNTKTYMAEVALDHVDAAIPDVIIASLYCHPFNGEGIYFLPEPEASCYVTIPSDGSRPFVLGYHMPANEDRTSEGDATDKSGRKDINPGDIILTTRDENFIILRRGGVVQIGATSLAQTLYIPMGNFIQSFFENYRALSPLGELSWTHDLDDYDKASKVRIKFKSKKLTDDDTSTEELQKNYAFDFEVFDSDTDDIPYKYATTAFKAGGKAAAKSGAEAKSKSFLRLFVRDPSKTDNKEVFGLQVSQTGRVHFDSLGVMTMNTAGHEVFSLGDMRTEVARLDSGKPKTTYARLVSSATGEVVENAAGDILICSKGTITLKAEKIVLDSSDVQVGSGPVKDSLVGVKTLQNGLTKAFAGTKKRPGVGGAFVSLGISLIGLGKANHVKVS